MFILANTVNWPFVKLLPRVAMCIFRCAEKIGHDKLIAEARRLGMDQKPFLNLPSLRDIPIVPDPVWKKNNLGVKWTMEDTFNISIGQGGLRKALCKWPVLWPSSQLI